MAIKTVRGLIKFLGERRNSVELDYDIFFDKCIEDDTLYSFHDVLKKLDRKAHLLRRAHLLVKTWTFKGETLEDAMDRLFRFINKNKLNSEYKELIGDKFPDRF